MLMKRISRLLFLAGLLVLGSAGGALEKSWTILVPEFLAGDPAVQLAVEDIQSVLAMTGSTVKTGTFNSRRFAALIIPAGSIEKSESAIAPLSEELPEQGYKISSGGGKASGLTIQSSTVSGLVFGLYKVWDEILIEKDLPALNLIESPRLEFRVASVSSKEEMRMALQRRITCVVGTPLNDIVPWANDSLKQANSANLARFRELVDYAHSLHLQVLLYNDEFTYHPSLLGEFGASPNPENENFWRALQEKYRRVFRVLPQLDGVMIRTGELTQAGGVYRAYNLMHGEEDSSDWSLEKRYRTFVKKMHEVVVGEFDKIYFQRTWVTTDYEQHSKAQVFRRIFTDDVPTKNLYLSPYVNAHDRWFFTAYNPTFNQTPHSMAVLLAPMDYHANYGVPVFPVYPGAYFQAALQTYFMYPHPNVRGAHFAVTANDGWNTWNLTSYTASRLAWNPDENIHDIARDFCSIWFGKNVAGDMAELYLMSPSAYKYGLYVEPATRGSFNTLPLLRLTTFPVMGFPGIDQGREHLEFLKKIYLQCKPWQEESLIYLDHGLEVAEQMIQKFQNIKGRFDDPGLAADVQSALELTRGLVATNNAYVRTIFAFFNYLEQATEENRTALIREHENLTASLEKFKGLPNCRYKTFGIDQLVQNAATAIADVEKANAIFREAPTVEQIKETVYAQQQKYKKVLSENASGAKKLLHWEGRIDGRDILHIRGDSMTVEHLRWDPGRTTMSRFLAPLPSKSVTLLIDDIESRPMHPFVLEQPNAGNNYTAKIYLYDEPGGTGTVKFDLYMLDGPPEEFGLDIPWQKDENKGRN